MKSPVWQRQDNQGICIEEKRQQRAGLFLCDVSYCIHAYLDLIGDEARGNPAKYIEMFQRRARKGQCVNQPYLGCREFAADFRLIEKPSEQSAPISETRELGWMLHDLDFSNPADPQPRFFNARMQAGVIEVPPFEEARG